jgi:hypothetical protein
LTQLQTAVPAAAYEAVPLPENRATAFTPEWWLYDLERELVGRQPLVDLYERYFGGHHRLNFATATYRRHFGEMLRAISDNWMALVIRAKVERIHVQGFRFGDEPEDDKDAWAIWQENNLDVDAPLAFTESAKHGESYLLVWPEQVGGTFGRFFRRRSQLRPRITPEHPSQFLVRREAGDRRRRAAAIKRWIEDDGMLMATLYLPDNVYRYQRSSSSEARWEPRRGVEFRSRNPFGVVPGVPLVNDPQMLPAYAPPACGVGNIAIGLGRSDLIDVISTQDQINKLLCDMMVAAEFAAFRQRWATGLEVPEDEDGNPKEPFNAAIDRLWIADKEGAKFGDFAPTDLKNYTTGLESRLQSMASRKRIPLHYLLGQSGDFPSGESLKATETGLVAVCDDAKVSLGEGCEEIERLGFAVLRDPRAHRTDAETIWRDSESRTESEHIDSLVKKLAFGVPFQQLWEDAGYSPQQIRRFRRMLLEVAVHRATDGNAFPQAAQLPPGEPLDEPSTGDPATQSGS